MEREQLVELQAILARRRQALDGMITGNRAMLHSKISPDLSGEVHLDFNHPADMVGSDPDYDKDIALIGLEEDELALIDEALVRIVEGTYGVCAHCADRIAYARLHAIPYTRFCVDCQKQAEKRPA